MTEPRDGWGLRISHKSGESFLVFGVFWARTEAIAHYNATWQKPNAYRRDRRKGKVLAVRVRIVEMNTTKEAKE